MNAIDLVLSIPSVKAEHSRLHAQATAELARLVKMEEALKIIADPKNWRQLNGEIVWNDFDGNEIYTEHAIAIATEALK